jgi:thioredoxin 1
VSKTTQVFGSDNWERDVLGSGDVVLVDFWAEWCAPCRKLTPTVEALATEYEGRARVGKLNVDEHPDVAARYGITSIPTLLVFKDGRLADKRIGALPIEELRSFLDRQLEEKLEAAG